MHVRKKFFYFFLVLKPKKKRNFRENKKKPCHQELFFANGQCHHAFFRNDTRSYGHANCIRQPAVYVASFIQATDIWLVLAYDVHQPVPLYFFKQTVSVMNMAMNAIRKLLLTRRITLTLGTCVRLFVVFVLCFFRFGKRYSEGQSIFFFG